MGKSFRAKRNGSAQVDVLFDLKLERMPDGVVRIYSPDRSGGLHVFQSQCAGPECCDGCLIEAAYDAFDFAIWEEREKRGVSYANFPVVLRLNGVPFEVKWGL